MIYCDTSFLISLYVGDSHSRETERHLATCSDPLVWTKWHGLEFRTGLEARVGRGLTRHDEANRIFDLLSKQRSPAGIYESCSVNWRAALDEATRLAADYGEKFTSRSLDVLQVAICVQLEVEQFWSFDTRQNDLAETVGLSVLK